MKKISILFLFASLLFCAEKAAAQSPKEMIAKVNQHFAKVRDYAADIAMNFQIPGVNIEAISGKVFYKVPDKFRVRTKGIIFLPKQNPYYALAMLKDTNAYTAVPGGTEKIGSVTCTIVNVIPNKDDDLILGKFWIDDARGLVIKSQLTTKSNGTIIVENQFGKMQQYALPDKMVFTVDMAKFKVPKAVAVDLNSKSKVDKNASGKGTGTITLQFSNYAINKQLKDAVFTQD
jgi:outer membrane lipoprotein-sorting protein